MGITLFVLPIFFCTITYGRTAEEYDKIIVSANESLEKGYTEQAFTEISQITSNEISIADDTTKLFYYITFGKINQLKQKNREAELCFDEAINLHESLKLKTPSYIDMLVLHAYASDALGKRDDALIWYRKAIVKGSLIEHNPDIDNNCYLNIGNIYNERGNYELAREFYNKIEWVDSLQKVEIHGDYFGKMSEKYIDFGKQGDWISAKNINDSLMSYTLIRYGETHPFYLLCLQSAGTIQTSLKDYVSAISPYKQLVDIGKKNSLIIEDVGYAYIRLIETYCNLDNLDNAIELFPEAVTYLKNLKNENCSKFETCLYIGLALIRNMDFENGIIALEKYLDNCPVYMRWGVPYAINKLTWAYLNVGRNDEVVEILTPLLSQDIELIDSFVPLKPHFHKTLGCSYYVLKEKEKSLFHLNEAIRLDPETMQNDDLITEIITEYNKEK